MPFWTTINLIAPHLLRRPTTSPRDLTNSLPSYSNLLQIRHMTRLIGKALEDDIANTILEDSEPERQAEEARLKEQQYRKRREQSKRSGEAKVEAQAEVSDEVIVVTESKRNPSAPLSLPECVESSIIEISDTTVGTLEGIAAPITPLPRHDLISSQSSEQEIQELLGQPPQLHQPVNLNIADHYNPPIDLTASTSLLTEQESLVPKLNIARFAFGKKPGPSTVPKLGFALSRQFSNTSTSEDNVPAAKASKTAKTAASFPSFASSFTVSQLTALSKCVVCNLAWTVRKTVPVKLSHIKSCARRNGWKEETIIVGLTREFGHISACTSSNTMQISKKSKDKGKAVADQPPKTFLEKVVNEAAPKKRRKKVQDVDVLTVLNPQDAHAAIMERAKALLGPPAPLSGSAQDAHFYPTTQIFSPSRLGASGRSGVLGLGMLEDKTARTSGNAVDPEQEVPQADDGKLPPSTTQAFHPSASAGKSAKQPVLYGDENGNDEQLGNDDAAEMPPTTQAFRQSTLSTKFGQSRQSLLGRNETASTFLSEVDNPARPPKSLQSTMKPLLAATRPRTFNIGALSTSSSVNDEHFHHPVTSQKKLADLYCRLAENRTDSQEGKVRLDLDLYPILPSEPVVTKITQTKGGKKTGNVCSISKGKRKALDVSSSRSPPKSKSKSRSRSRSRSRKPSGRCKSRSPLKDQRVPEEECNDNCFSETLDEDLYRIIKEDRALYERILRYEPIHFDVFLKLTGIQDMNDRGIKLRLRTFLDRQAINFYGDSALAANRRRYK